MLVYNLYIGSNHIVLFLLVLTSIKLVDLCYICGSGGMAKSSIPLPEISVEDFKHHGPNIDWRTNGRNRRVAVFPALLRSKLVEYYVSLENGKKPTLRH